MLTFNFYSPEEEINSSLFQEKDIRVFIKRDDKIHPYISGNKWRKLKYSLEHARILQKNRLVTFGGAWSNHLLATAAAGAQFGFQTFAFVRGETVDNPVLSLCKIFGMELCFVDRKAYKEKAQLFEKHFGTDDQAYFIDEGGYGPLAAKGISELLTELQREYSAIFCACGTGTTLAGLIQGLATNNKTQLHGIPVLKGGDFIYDELRCLGVDPDKAILHTDYHFGGYAKTKPELIDFCKEFTQATGILIEPTYTGKLFYGLYDLIKQDYFPPKSKVLLIHTGGLTGLLGMLDKF